MTTPAERRAEQRENQKYFSGKVSELSRYIGFGLVAAAFSLLSKSTDFTNNLIDGTDTLLIWTALIGCGVVLLDYVQMFSGWRAATNSAENTQGQYIQTKSAKNWRCVQEACFIIKQLAAILGSGLLVYSLLCNL